MTLVVSPPCPRCGTVTPIAISPICGSDCGDLIVCVNCGELCIITLGLDLRLMEPADLEQYELDAIARIVRAASDYRASRERRN